MTGTADAPQRFCPMCRRPEHGSIACEAVSLLDADRPLALSWRQAEVDVLHVRIAELKRELAEAINHAQKQNGVIERAEGVLVDECGLDDFEGLDDAIRLVLRRAEAAEKALAKATLRAEAAEATLKEKLGEAFWEGWRDRAEGAL